MEFSKSTIRSLMRKSGIKRASEKAVLEFTNVLEKFAGYIAEEAQHIAESEGRKTVKKEDVLAAISER